MTREEIIIKMMPFSKEIRDWCKTHPDFNNALKIIYPARFIILGAIYTSYSPNKPRDQVIGFLVYDYKTKYFKQDFIVNVNNLSNEFVLYTRIPSQMGQQTKYVKDISVFYSIYGKDGYYEHTHHLTFDDLGEEIKPRAKRAIELAEKLQNTGLRVLTEKELIEVDNKLSTIPYQNGK